MGNCNPDALREIQINHQVYARIARDLEREMVRLVKE